MALASRQYHCANEEMTALLPGDTALPQTVAWRVEHRLDFSPAGFQLGISVHCSTCLSAGGGPGGAWLPSQGRSLVIILHGHI